QGRGEFLTAGSRLEDAGSVRQHLGLDSSRSATSGIDKDIRRSGLRLEWNLDHHLIGFPRGSQNIVDGSGHPIKCDADASERRLWLADDVVGGHESLHAWSDAVA